MHLTWISLDDELKSLVKSIGFSIVVWMMYNQWYLVVISVWKHQLPHTSITHTHTQSSHFSWLTPHFDCVLFGIFSRLLLFPWSLSSAALSLTRFFSSHPNMMRWALFPFSYISTFTLCYKLIAINSQNSIISNTQRFLFLCWFDDGDLNIILSL